MNFEVREGEKENTSEESEREREREREEEEVGRKKEGRRLIGSKKKKRQCYGALV